MVTGFNQLLMTLAEADFFTGVLPFVVTYVVFFMVLRQVHLFEDDRAPAIISIAAAFFMARFIVLNPAYQTFFVDLFGRLVIGMVGLLGLFTVLAMGGWGEKIFQRKGLLALMLVMVGAAFTVSGGASAFLPQDRLSGMASQITKLLFDTGLIWIIAVAALLGWTLSDSDSESSSSRGGWVFEPVGGD
ncbi:MAG: hypothetical protein ABEJ98_05965 [Candidatus Nanohaloarchaea archaeon]